jgi:hypothetical protein
MHYPSRKDIATEGINEAWLDVNNAGAALAYEYLFGFVLHFIDAVVAFVIWYVGSNFIGVRT